MTYAAQPGAPAAEPKRAIGLRLLAWVLDLILYCLVAIAAFVPLAERAEGVSDFGDDLSGDTSFGTTFCSRLRESRPVSECIELGDTAWYTTGGRSVAHFAVALAWFLGTHVLLQGLTGGSLGKLIAGVRVVQEDGSRPGVGRALVRSLFWVVDGIPCCMPLVGLVTLLATGRKQRVGDLVAKTFVVKAGDRGRPVAGGGSASGPPPAAPGGYPPAPGYPPSGYGPPPSPGYPPAPGYPPTPGYPPPPGPGPPPASGFRPPPA